MNPPVVFPGDVFGRLTVLAQDGGFDGGYRTYRCQCSCGAVVSNVVAKILTRTKSPKRSCGCLQREIASRSLSRNRQTFKTHGQTGSPTWRSWAAMLTRCSNPRQRAWKDYGGRGITVCDRWQDFENFLADMGERPDGMTMDRIDPDGNYEPGNCRWAGPTQQSTNRRRTIQVTAFGETKVLKHWALDPRCKVSRMTLTRRLRDGMSPEEAISTGPLR